METGWTPTTPLRHYTRQVDFTMLAGQQLDLDTVLVTPGGRWAIAASSAGCVWWFDLSDDWTSTAATEPQILIPSTLCAPEATEEPIQIRFAIDFFSEESLGPSKNDHHLSQFNIAVVTRPAENSSSSSAHVGVWRIDVLEESGGGLKLGDCLSAYAETGTVKVTDVNLYGSAAVYGLDAGGITGIVCVVIVEWAGVNKKTRDDGGIVRRYIPSYTATKVILLPGDRILVVHEHYWADIFAWRKDCPPSGLHPSEQENVDVVKPIWSYDERNRGPVEYEVMAHPLVFLDTIRLVLPASRKIYGLTIPVDDRTDHEDGIQIQTLFSGYWKMHQAWQLFAHRHAAGSRDGGVTVFAAQYQRFEGSSSADDSGAAARFVEVNVPDGMLKSTRFVTRYEQYSQRVVLVDNDVLQFVTLVS